MLIKNIEQKIRINKMVSIIAIIFSFLTSAAVLFYSFSLLKDSRKSIYILDSGIPILVKQTDELLNRPVEYKSQIQLFHRMFFTLPPDDKYIKENVEKSLYLIDDSGKKEYANLREKGFYNQIISSNSILTLKIDSINIDVENNYYELFGKQIINRTKSLSVRNLHTSGNFKDVTRTQNNTHGVLLTNWKILDNTEISKQNRNAF
jgi:conjugative transposon TraK protein